MMNWKTRVLPGLLVAASVGVVAVACSWWWNPAPVPDAAPTAETAAPAPEFTTQNLPIRRGDTLAELLGRAKVDGTARARMIAAIRSAFDVKKFRAGSHLTLARTAAGTLESITYNIDADHQLRLSRSHEAFQAAVVDIPGTIHPVSVCGTLAGSLFTSIERVGERPELALRLAEIFAWDIDFYTDPQQGDQFCVLVEKKEYLNGQPSTYRRILAAKYNNAGTLYDAYLFPDHDGRPQYYSSDGRSLQAAFLRSPMKFAARVSSHFSRHRFHPILKIYRPHLGTDYAAPAGTPVQAVAAGRVTFSGRSGGAGNLIKIKHANGFETMYMHLSRRFVRRGQRVRQGQRIGLVGATGLATGPHLDFRLRKHGRYFDFEHLKPPRKSRISPRQMKAFHAVRNRYFALMTPNSRPGSLVLAKDTTPAATRPVD